MKILCDGLTRSLSVVEELLPQDTLVNLPVVSLPPPEALLPTEFSIYHTL